MRTSTGICSGGSSTFGRIFARSTTACDAGGRLGTRQQHLRLDVNQRCGHDEEVAGDVEVQFLHQVNRVEVLLRDDGDGNVVDVELVLPDQMLQQIERTLEVLELDGK